MVRQWSGHWSGQWSALLRGAGCGGPRRSMGQLFPRPLLVFHSFKASEVSRAARASKVMSHVGSLQDHDASDSNQSCRIMKAIACHQRWYCHCGLHDHWVCTLTPPSLGTSSCLHDSFSRSLDPLKTGSTTTRPIKDQTPSVALPLKPSLPPSQAFARSMHSQDPSPHSKIWLLNYTSTDPKQYGQKYMG